MEQESPIISAVVPVYCEGAPLAEALSVISEQLQGCKATFELIVVDDGSTDDTWQAIMASSERIAEMRALRLSRNFGKEAAIAAGLDAARGEVSIVMDADLQHPPKLIPEMFTVWRKTGASIVEAVKTHRGKERLITNAGSWIYYKCFKKLVGFDLQGATDFKLIDSNVRKAWLQLGERNLFFRGMIAWLGFDCEVVSFEVPERHAGVSHWPVLRLLGLAVTSATAFSSIPLFLVVLAGLVLLVIAVVLGSWAIYLKATGSAVSGFTTVICLQLIIGGFIMFSLGIIGVYLAQIYREVKGRPRYIVKQQTPTADAQHV